MVVGCTIWVRRSVQDVYGFFHYVLSLYIIKVCYTVSYDIVILIEYMFIILWYFVIDHSMPPKKYTMDKLDKKFDEKLSSFKLDLVSDLKKEIMNEVKAILNEKDKEIEDLKSQVTLLQNHVKHALDKKSWWIGAVW